MMAGSYSFNQRPDTLMQDHHRQIDETPLRRTAGPYIAPEAAEAAAQLLEDARVWKIVK
jgi:hypothetical protein